MIVGIRGRCLISSHLVHIYCIFCKGQKWTLDVVFIYFEGCVQFFSITNNTIVQVVFSYRLSKKTGW